MSILIFKTYPKIDEHGHERICHGTPQADIRRARDYKFSDAFGRPPNTIEGGFKAVLIDLGSKRGLQNFQDHFSYIPF